VRSYCLIVSIMAASVTAIPLALTATTMSGCAAQKAREDVLVPAMQLASYGLEKDALAGAATLPAELQESANATIDAFFSIVRGGDDEALRQDAIVTWGRVQELVELGIEAKQDANIVSAEAAQLMRQRARDFDNALRAYITRSPALLN
jgi:hypothetical protein